MTLSKRLTKEANMKHFGYHVGFDAHKVDGRFAVLLADNGEQADERICLMAAPVIASPGLVALYISTNGDPSQVCTLDHAGNVVWYLGEDMDEGGGEPTIAKCLEGFSEFAGMNSQECAEWCATLFGAHCER